MNTLASKGRVLCIDDEPHVLRALQWLLKKDFEVHTCESAAEALRLLRNHDFDVVVSDQRMPGITGVEFLRHVRKLAPRAMRILLTGYSDLDSMVNSVNESEVFRFITKPWDVKGLPKIIAEAAQVAREEESAPTDAAPVRAAEGVLVIDDSQELHAMADQALEGSVAVLHAFDLPAALEILDTRAVSVILSEVQVGGLDATRLLFTIRRNHPRIVTLVASGQRDAAVVMALINQGQVFRIVPKPLKPAFIRLLVEAALKRHRELLANPALQRRFAVEEMAAQLPETAPRLAETAPQHPETAPRAAVSQAKRPAAIGIAAAPASSLRGASFVAGVKSGLRRLFGT